MSQDDTITAAPRTPSPGFTPGPSSEPIHEATHTAPTPTTPPQTQSWLPWRPKPVAEILDKNFARRFRGKWALHNIRHVFWPRKPADTDPETLAGGYTEAKDWDDPQGDVVKTPKGKYTYRNEFHRDRNKYMDNAVYLSPTHARPRRLVVQATGKVLRSVEQGAETGDWIRTRMKGNVPIVLRISEWSLGPLQGGRWWNKVSAAWRVLLVSVPLQLMLASPWVSEWDDGDMKETYTDFPGYYWNWPRYAINVLDEAPGPDGLPKRMGRHPADVRGRSIRPSKIVIHKGNDEWAVVNAKDYPSVRYIFISYEWKQFAEEDQVKRMARAITKEKGYKAYWLDRQCIHQPDGLEKDYDVYTMCDIVRSSGLVAVLLSEDTEQARIDWGSRLWTLPEGMLAPGDSVTWCHETSPGVLHHDEVHKVEMTSTFWGEPDGERYEGGSPIRILAEHYSNLLTLSRLELLPSIVNALAAQGWTNKADNHSDLAYAVMGFLHYRLERNEDDTLFQNLARLSLSNDSDRIIERMISILPKPPDRRKSHPGMSDLDNNDVFHGLALPDEFGTRVHDITPLFDVVGMAHEDDTVLVDNCKAMHIRWKDFPRPVVQRQSGTRRKLAAFFVTAGLWWLMWGFDMTINWVPFWAGFAGPEVETEKIEWLVEGFLFVAVLLSVAGPFSVRRLFGGVVEKSSPSLVAFEGVLPISQVETVVFGNDEGRLTYAPSSTPFCNLKHARHKRERRGIEPDWIAHPEKMLEYLPKGVPDGHHLFTLVDMGDLSVSILSAERPPTVALLCGREGGMLRAVLCSWRFENDCLYKETVVRMPSTVYEYATPKDWLKLCLKTQNQAKRKRARAPPRKKGAI
ncbi:hypothetical protein VM1G_10276 [Cytospora mali]|uniref:Heterokaryon incompatibility domain-containing protein n=1 Tax=Cytospora mali TaxID=578113 RepID=A0A194VHQ8_CYTMA|nr:hypothetical protein VM1G_10276 [Valsa mali]